MKTLIVDDQYQNKAEIIAKLLKEIGCFDIDHVASSRAALKSMRGCEYDLLVLDLHIPAEIGGEVEAGGGQALLEFVELNDNIRKPRAVVAITSHKDSYESAAEFFGRRGWTLTLGVEDEDYLRSIFLTKKMHLKSEKFDIVFVTALEKTELEAVRDLPCDWQTFQRFDDVNIYHRGTLKIADGSIRQILAVSLPRMGMVAAAAVVTKLCILYSPSVVVMVGIAAGIKGTVELGDILIADPSWEWGSGKLTVRDGKPTFLSDPHQMTLDPVVSAEMRHIAASRKYLDEIQNAWRGKETQHRLNLHLGPVASGAVVLEDPQTVSLIKAQNRKTIGVEMEAYGVMAAVLYSRKNPPTCIVIKSVCDFADPLKNNEWQTYAAYTSAQFAFRYLRDFFSGE
ncbi:phosphorylase family protein [Achromobacter dolens]|uniref:phosphorylase family protein n=1 Tax=Achromobacter dolens TaxID=1287738 RepID=UPI0006BEC18C|nr:response regulator [Achromobacter dolens]CUJ77314.1 5'-methylthioadenosine/S-adenosylhomocysteine nucleosidase [Achromobacter dolens]